MSDVTLGADSLGRPSDIGFLIFRLFAVSERTPMSDVRNYCVNHIYGVGERIDGVFRLLDALGVLLVSGNQLSRGPNFSRLASLGEDRLFEDTAFYELLFRMLADKELLREIFSTTHIRKDDRSGLISLTRSKIPMRLNGFITFLVNVGFFRKADLGKGVLVIRETFSEFFVDRVIPLINRAVAKGRLSLAGLKQRIEAQEQSGREAELFVEVYEKRRLQGHTFISEIRRVSDENVSLGYDVQSFNSRQSLLVDRFIEVKSFTGNEYRFIWTRYEVEVAKEFGDAYFLYLVDKARMADTSYQPLIMQNPYREVFDDQGPWRIDPHSWLIIRKVGTSNSVR